MSRLLATCALVGTLACSDESPQPAGIIVGTGGCSSARDCEDGALCLLQQCVRVEGAGNPDLQPILSATPGTLNFGTLSAGQSRRLALIVSNVGNSVVTIDSIRIEPTGAFGLEQMGTAPYWIRPGRHREVFVRYMATGTGPLQSVLMVDSEAPQVTVTLLGN